MLLEVGLLAMETVSRTRAAIDFRHALRSLEHAHTLAEKGVPADGWGVRGAVDQILGFRQLLKSRRVFEVSVFLELLGRLYVNDRCFRNMREKVQFQVRVHPSLESVDVT